MVAGNSPPRESDARPLGEAVRPWAAACGNAAREPPGRWLPFPVPVRAGEAGGLMSEVEVIESVTIAARPEQVRAFVAGCSASLARTLRAGAAGQRAPQVRCAFSLRLPGVFP